MNSNNQRAYALIYCHSRPCCLRDNNTDCPSIPISAGSSRFHSFYPVSRRSPQRGIQNPAFSRSKLHDRCICMQAHARPEKAWLREAIYRYIYSTVYAYGVRVRVHTIRAYACILYTVYYTVLLYYDNRGNAYARSFVAQRVQCTCIRRRVYGRIPTRHGSQLGQSDNILGHVPVACWSSKVITMATCINSSLSCLLPFYTIPIFPLLNRKIFHLLVY